MKDQIEILKRFECNMEKRTKLKEIKIQGETKTPWGFVILQTIKSVEIDKYINIYIYLDPEAEKYRI